MSRWNTVDRDGMDADYKPSSTPATEPSARPYDLGKQRYGEFVANAPAPEEFPSWEAISNGERQAWMNDVAAHLKDGESLPELPFSPVLVIENRSPTERHSWTAYTADQMQGYARATIKSLSAPAAAVGGGIWTPAWKDAPTWAEWRAWDHVVGWSWFEKEPFYSTQTGWGGPGRVSGANRAPTPDARASLQPRSSSAVTPPAGGFVVVPREPTMEMMDALSRFGIVGGQTRRKAYAALIAASPTAQPSAKDGVRGEGVVSMRDALTKCREVLRNIIRDKKGGVHYAAAQSACHWANEALEATTASGLVDGAMVERLAAWFTKNATVKFHKSGVATTSGDYIDHARAALEAALGREDGGGNG